MLHRGGDRSESESGLVCSVVIPTYNARATLDETLSALASQSFEGSFEILIADNASTDGSAEVARGWAERLPHLRVVDASRRRGVSAARNDGIRAAATDTILICDADDVADHDWVKAMLAGLNDSDFVGGALETTRLNAPAAQTWVSIPSMSTELPMTWGGRAYAFGGNLGMRLAVFEDTGGFDETYGAGAEEIDFAWRALDVGHQVRFVPGAVIHYRLRADLRGVLRQQYWSGVGITQLYATFRPAEETPRSLHKRVRHELALLRRFPFRGDRATRGAWLSMMAFEAGKFRGALKHRCPVP